MSSLHIEPATVRLLAARCRAWAADLAAPAEPACGSIPATAAAVATVHRALRATAESLERGMRETAELMEEAAGHFQTTDSSSAGTFNGVAIRM